LIRVTPAPEPPDFNAKVRQPGLSAIDEFLGRPPRLKRPGPKRSKIADHEQDIPAEAFPPYWRQTLPEMLAAYEHRCSYLAMYIHDATGSPTVDHVLPKSCDWNHVYEWSNYRLCAAIINSKKGQLLSLIDPFDVQLGWFVLNVNTLHVERDPNAPQAEWVRIDATLPLLNQRPCVREREEYVRCYQLGPGAGGFDLVHLEFRAPFIAFELRRQEKLLRGDA